MGSEPPLCWPPSQVTGNQLLTCSHRNKSYWNLKPNIQIYFEENRFKNVADILEFFSSDLSILRSNAIVDQLWQGVTNTNSWFHIQLLTHWSLKHNKFSYLVQISVLLAYMGSMIASSNGNIFRVTGPLDVETTDHRWIPFTKANDVELCSFVSSSPEQTIKQTIETPVSWYAITMSLRHHCNANNHTAVVVYMMARWRIGDKPSPEPMITKFADAPSGELTHWPLGHLNKILDK